MKRALFIIILLAGSALSISADPVCSSDCGKPFFRTRAAVEQAKLFLALNEYYYFMNQDEEYDACPNFIAAGLFYEKSRKNGKLAPFFLPNCECTTEIREDGTGDVGSLWLSVIAQAPALFSSDLSLCPQRSAWGVYFNYHRNFVCHDGWWLDIKAAAYQAKHALNPCEKLNDEDALGTVNDIETALDFFNSSELNYGRISRGCLKRGGFDDIELKVGYDWICPNSYWGLFGSVLLPTAPKPKACYLFEPLIGRGHFGLGFGLNGGTTLYECGNHTWSLLTELSYQYLFRRKELRSFDLVNNGQWSRYLRVATESEPAVSFPAINYTTLCANVTMRSTINWWAALHHNWCAWHFELGYNLWWRQKEKICLDECARNCFNNANIGIFGMGNVCTPTSASTADISQGKTFSGTGNVVTNDATFVALTADDLDLCAAATPSALTNTLYAALARDVVWCKQQVSLGLGASYEFARCATAIEQWGIWANVNVNF